MKSCLCLSRKRRMHSVSGRHDEDCWRNATDVFQKAYTAFYYLRSLPSTHRNCLSEYRHRTKCFEVYYTPFTLLCVGSIGGLMRHERLKYNYCSVYWLGSLAVKVCVSEWKSWVQHPFNTERSYGDMDLGLKSHLKDRWSRESNQLSLG